MAVLISFALTLTHYQCNTSMKFTGEHLQLLCSIKKSKQQTMAKKLLLSQQMVSKLFRKDEIPQDKFALYVQALDLTMEQEINFFNKFPPPPPPQNEV